MWEGGCTCPRVCTVSPLSKPAHQIITLRDCNRSVITVSSAKIAKYILTASCSNFSSQPDSAKLGIVHWHLLMKLEGTNREARRDKALCIYVLDSPRLQKSSSHQLMSVKSFKKSHKKGEPDHSCWCSRCLFSLVALRHKWSSVALIVMQSWNCKRKKLVKKQMGKLMLPINKP